MRALVSIVSSIVIAAGIVVGYIDYREDRAERARSAASSAAIQPPSAARPGAETAARGKVVSEADAKDEAGGGSGAPTGGGDAVARKDPDAPGNGTIGPDPRLAQLRDLVAKRDHAGAADLGKRIVETPRARAADVEEAARLTARARVLDRLARVLPEPKPTSGAAEVFLANGSKVRARKVEREGERHVIHLMTGGTFVPAPEDVLQVRELDPATFRASEWKRIQDRIETTTHPLDLYLDGVERCFELGLREEGFVVLDRILSMQGTETDQIPILFIPDVDEATLHDWRVAAGREKPRWPSSEAAGDVGTAVVTARDGGGLATPVGDDAGREPPPVAVTPGAQGSIADPAELVKAAQLVAEAQMLYQGAARKEGKDDDLRKARDKLDRALEIVEPQPQGDDTARRLRRQIAQLLSDVARASPF